jgi:glycine betaine/choline ABC-type transport system substrate-binding protein
MKPGYSTILALSAILFTLFTSPAHSCVGRILNIAVNDTPEQRVVGQLLATYITERTGTTVNLVTAEGDTTPESMVKDCKAEMYINYLDAGLAEIEPGKKDIDPQEAYGLVKRSYFDKFQMVWLKPLGYKGPLQGSDTTQGNGSLAAVVTTQQVLDRFPVLDRVINKLSGRIDSQTLEQLLQKSQGKDTIAVVKDYLKNQNLI